MEERQVIFVCTGNTCRSPMAEAIFRSELKRLNIQGVGVLSAGIEAAKKGNINPCSAAVLSENGLSLENFNSRLLEKEMLRTAYALICMTDSQRDLLMELRWKLLREAGFSEIENNVYSFSELAGYEIPDPFGKDIDCYRLTYRKLAEGMTAVIRKLFPETAGEKGGEKAPAPADALPAKKKGTASESSTETKKARKTRAKPRKRVVRSKDGKNVSATGTKRKAAVSDTAKKSAKSGKKLASASNAKKNSSPKQKTSRNE